MVSINGDGNELLKGIPPSGQRTNHVIPRKRIAAMAMKFQKEAEKTLKNATAKGYNPNLTIQSSRVSNKYYKGDEYEIHYDGFNVTIKNKNKNYTKTFNIYNYVAGMKENDKIEFLKKIQTLSGEVLEDLSNEIDRLNSATGQDMHTVQSNPNFVAGGYYRSDTDEITTKPKHLVHELGHAVDFNANQKSLAANDPVFKAAFAEELKNYINAGNVRYDYNNNSTGRTSALGVLMQQSNYCTANEREMFAEIYAMCMTGGCKSAGTITKYFPKTLARGQQLLALTRSHSASSRHDSPNRRLSSAMNAFKA